MEDQARYCDMCRRASLDLYSLQAYYQPGSWLDRSLDWLDRTYHCPSTQELAAKHPPFYRSVDDLEPDCPVCQVLKSMVCQDISESPVLGVQLIAEEIDEDDEIDYLKSLAKNPLRKVSFSLGHLQYFPVSLLRVLLWCGEETHSWDSHWDYLRIFVDPACSPSLRKHISGRAICSPDSDLNMGKIKKWLEDCIKSHGRCRKGLSGGALDDRIGGGPLPSRIIDVGLKPGSPVRLVATNGLRGRYCALSYCWAPRSPRDGLNTLLNNTIEQFMRRLPLEELPKPILDAIEVTRRIGVPYLWVDRLCIIQDDKQDQQNECDRMCDVYEQALLTLAALGDGTGEEGLFLPREVLDHTPSGDPSAITTRPPLRAKLPCTLKGKQLGDVYIARVPHPRASREPFELELAESKWVTRGWIVQERLLSRRILYFGKCQLYWECQRRFWSEDGISEEPAGSHPEKTGLMKRDFVMDLMTDDLAQRFVGKTHMQEAIHSHWTKIVEHYSGRKLTVADDRLRAISGVSEALRRRYSLKNVHFGMWMDSLSEELAWYPRGPDGTVTKSAKSRAPSWSWVASDGTVAYFHDWFGDNPAAHSLRKSQFKLVDIGAELPVLQLRGVVFGIQPRPLSDDGERAELANWVHHIKSLIDETSIRALLFWDTVTDNDPQEVDSMLTIQGTPVGAIRYDDRSDKSGGSDCLLLSVVDTSDNKRRPVYWLYMMVLEKIDCGETRSRPTFRRVGIAEAVWIPHAREVHPFHFQQPIEIHIE